MLSASALAMIGGYQRWISPRKGWSCAYRVAHGGTGCSGFAKVAIREHGILRALPLIRQRFRDCHAAAVMLQAEDGEERKKEHWYNRCEMSGCATDFGPCCRSKHGGGPDTTPDGCDCAPDGCS